MAILSLTYMSHALWRSVPVQVILPTDKFSPAGELPPRRKFKTLYLLHGLMGCSTDWMTSTRIKRWAQERNLAVVMPSGDNSWYVDQPASHNRYGEFLGRELLEITRRSFPLSERREDTFIGGLSMGGYGALLCGLTYPDAFGAIIGLSSATDMLNPSLLKLDREIPYYESIFGDLEKAAASDLNPSVLIKKLGSLKKAQPGLALPRVYLACGTEDPLLPCSRDLRGQLAQNGFDVAYEEGPGGHNWDFWDEYIRRALDWLPLDGAHDGLNSGNVGL